MPSNLNTENGIEEVSITTTANRNMTDHSNQPGMKDIITANAGEGRD